MRRLRRLDAWLLREMRTRCHPPGLERAVIAYSRLGEHGAIWLAAGVAGAMTRGRNRATYRRLLRVVLITELSAAALKRITRRARPELEGLPALARTRSRLTYPSAHAATSFAAARVLSSALPALPAHAAATAMALSRPYLGVHYPSDVLAGTLLGLGLAELLLWRNSDGDPIRH